MGMLQIIHTFVQIVHNFDVYPYMLTKQVNSWKLENITDFS